MRTSKTKPAKAAAPAPSMKRSNIFLPQAMKEDLAELAERKGTTSADLVRTSVATMLKRHGFKHEEA